MGLLAQGALPKRTRTNTTTRKLGKWRGHEDLAEELRKLREREPNPEECWGMVATQINATKASSIVSAIKKGQSPGFEHDGRGVFEAKSYKSPIQKLPPDMPPIKGLIYDVWARYTPIED